MLIAMLQTVTVPAVGVDSVGGGETAGVRLDLVGGGEKAGIRLDLVGGGATAGVGMEKQELLWSIVRTWELT